MTYNICNTLITNGNYIKDDMLLKLDVFLLNNRITQKDYNELTEMMK